MSDTITAPTEAGPASGSEGCAVQAGDPVTLTPGSPATDWLTPMIHWARVAAADRLDTMPSQEPVFSAYATATAALRIAIMRLETGEPYESMRDVLVRGLLGAEALMGEPHFTHAVEIMKRHELLRAQVAAGHYLVAGAFWQGRWWLNRCACGRVFERQGAPCLSDAEDHVAAPGEDNINAELRRGTLPR